MYPILFWSLVGFGAYMLMGYVTLLGWRFLDEKEVLKLLKSNDSIFMVLLAWPIILLIGLLRCLALMIDGITFFYKKIANRTINTINREQIIKLILFIPKNTIDRKTELVKDRYHD